MNFEQAFEKVKASVSGENAGTIQGHLAIEVRLCDTDAYGICYIEIRDGELFVEPYDYFDRDAIFTVTSGDLVRIMTGRLGYDKAIEKGLLTVEGDAERAAEIKKLVTKMTRKSGSKAAK